MEKVGVAFDALQLLLRLKYESTERCIFSNTGGNFYFVTMWFNNNIQKFVQTLNSSIEGMPSSIVTYKILKVGTILQDSTHKLDPRGALVGKDCKAKSVKCTSLLLII